MRPRFRLPVPLRPEEVVERLVERLKQPDQPCQGLVSREHRVVELRVEPRNSRGEASVWRWGREKASGAIVAGDPEASDIVSRQRRDGGWNVYEKHRKDTTKAKLVSPTYQFCAERSQGCNGQ